MAELIFNLVTDDASVLSRWTSAFQKESWKVGVCPAADNAPAPAGCAEIRLIEVCTPLCKTPDDLREAIKDWKPVATLAFADPQAITNPQIARFLEAGADDFVYKNLDERILVAKLKAHIRRLSPSIAGANAKLASGNGEVELDKASRTVRISAGSKTITEISNLTLREFEILQVLLTNEKQVMSRETLLEKVWGEKATDVYSECVDKHIESLRKKLGLYGKKIRTVYGSGYTFTTEIKK